MPEKAITCTIGFSVNLLEAPQNETVREARAAVRDLQCVTLAGQVLFSLTVKESISYSSAAGLTTETFDIPYANAIVVPEAVPGRPCRVNVRIVTHDVRLERERPEAACEVDVEVAVAAP